MTALPIKTNKDNLKVLTYIITSITACHYFESCMTQFTVTIDIFVCHNHNPFHSSLVTYHWVCNKSNKMGGTYGAGTAYTSGTTEFTPGFQWGSCCSLISFLCSILQINVCPFFFLPLYCLYFFDVRLFITRLVSSTYRTRCDTSDNVCIK